MIIKIIKIMTTKRVLNPFIVFSRKYFCFWNHDTRSTTGVKINSNTFGENINVPEACLVRESTTFQTLTFAVKYSRQMHS